MGLSALEAKQSPSSELMVPPLSEKHWECSVGASTASFPEGIRDYLYKVFKLLHN